MKHLLDFDDPGAGDDEPVKGITVGDIRAWYDQYSKLLASWAECRDLLTKERAVTANADALFRERMARDLANWEI